MIEMARESRRGECPACGMPVPFLKTQWSLGTPFKCRNCGADIVIPKAKPLAATTLYIAAASFARSVGFLIVFALLLIGCLLNWQFSTVRLADPGD